MRVADAILILRIKTYQGPEYKEFMRLWQLKWFSADLAEILGLDFTLLCINNCNYWIISVFGARHHAALVSKL
jgi:hypothetical protein